MNEVESSTNPGIVEDAVMFGGERRFDSQNMQLSDNKIC
jgi:hypothetical protein